MKLQTTSFILYINSLNIFHILFPYFSFLFLFSSKYSLKNMSTKNIIKMANHRNFPFFLSHCPSIFLLLFFQKLKVVYFNQCSITSKTLKIVPAYQQITLNWSITKMYFFFSYNGKKISNNKACWRKCLNVWKGINRKERKMCSRIC